MEEEIILASASPRRKDLLEQIGVGFRIIPADIDENLDDIAGSAEEKVERLAVDKAGSIAGGLDKGYVIGADTVVVIDGEILGKPKDEDDAYSMLSRLSGNVHNVITGMAVINAENGMIKSGYETTRVFFDNLSDRQIRNYIKSGECFDKAGAYAVQGLGSLMVRKIDGDYYNVVGLPVNRLSKLLSEFGIQVL